QKKLPVFLEEHEGNAVEKQNAPFFELLAALPRPRVGTGGRGPARSDLEVLDRDQYVRVGHAGGIGFWGTVVGGRHRYCGQSAGGQLVPLAAASQDLILSGSAPELTQIKRHRGAKLRGGQKGR